MPVITLLAPNVDDIEGENGAIQMGLLDEIMGWTTYAFT